MKGAELLVNNCAGTRRSGFEIKAVIFQNFFHVLAPGVEREERDRAAAVGKEVNFVSDPHGAVVVGILTRKFYDARIGKIRDPNRGSEAATIVLNRDVAVAGAKAAIPSRNVGEVGRVC